MSNRLGSDELFMTMAHLLAQRGTCQRAQVGAIFVRDRRIVSTGYVGSPPGKPHCIDVGCVLGPDGGCVATVHAEENGVGFAARYGVPLEGTSVYTTMSPCINCAKLLLTSGVTEVVFHERYRDETAFEMLKGKVKLTWFDDTPHKHMFLCNVAKQDECLICQQARMYHVW